MAEGIYRGLTTEVSRPVAELIELHHEPLCRTIVCGDSSYCTVCHAQWDTNELPGNMSPNCKGRLDPIRGGLLT